MLWNNRKEMIFFFPVDHKDNNISWQNPTFPPFLFYIVLNFKKKKKQKPQTGKPPEILRL